MSNTILIRPYQPSDSIPEITALLHKAYAELAAQGLLFLASHQSDMITKDRLVNGASFLVVKDGAIVGAITVYGPHRDSEVPLYRRPGVYHFGQFAVDPDLRGAGLGKRLYMTIENHCKANKVKTLALDTAETAVQLIDLYQRWGFKIVDRVKWDVTNYKSVIMAKDLTAARAIHASDEAGKGGGMG